MLTQLTQIFRAYHTDLASHRLFLACSGGRDSLSLAWACKLLYEQGELPTLPILLHVHHGWQAANDEWANLVACWAAQHGFECRILSVKLPKNNETFARDARYRALAGVMADGDVLFVAHHADDQAETMLMRLVNGAGVVGLSGMKVWQDRRIQDKQLRLCRPMLQMTRKQISKFAKSHNLPYVNDPTNTNDDHVRGKLRNHVLPVFEQINPQAIQNITRSGQLLAQASEIVSMFIDDKLASAQDALTQMPFCQVLNIGQVVHLPTSVQSSVVHAWLSKGEILPPSQRLVKDVLGLIHRRDGNHQTRLFWQGEHGHVVCRYGMQIYCYRKEAWECLLAPSCVKWSSGEVVLKQTEECALIWQVLPDFLGKKVQLYPVSRQTIVPLHQGVLIKQLHGKKLMQTLGVPAWLRDNLWLVCVDDFPTLLLTAGQAWRLNKNSKTTGAKFCVMGTDGVKWQADNQITTSDA
ncbi:tRNA lysidine(34) synthetase TilS [Moraxella sp. Tifton1]|uniref:tRNA lysidine(34) synthetase TilS n=1 Tax=Moraxella oculi TaxID=2940516 RepID=UPI00201213B8|nr:tRNA lysidine(34) synthetase TilS [Moraxella sp. Tifton1]MCL1623691.1 tRNA lysidine(34) synthetase TilS [Moraxella sp. Tifton1]